MKTSKCPAGHALPNYTPTGQCTPLYCGVSENQTKRVRQSAPVALARVKKAEVVAAGDGGEKAIGAARSRFKARLAALGAPEDLQGQAAEEWADKRIIANLPLAVAEIEFNLKFGDDSQRERAAQRIMDATGRGKTERMGGGVSPVLILNMGGDATLPWRKPREAVVDALSVPQEGDANAAK